MSSSEELKSRAQTGVDASGALCITEKVEISLFKVLKYVKNI